MNTTIAISNKSNRKHSLSEFAIASNVTVENALSCVSGVIM